MTAIAAAPNPLVIVSPMPRSLAWTVARHNDSAPGVSTPTIRALPGHLPLRVHGRRIRLRGGALTYNNRSPARDTLVRAAATKGR